jgi:AcrR family transcriptional regulator
MRLVAQSAGISPGNLTYHFPKKIALLRALISRIMEDYSRQLEAMLSDHFSVLNRCRYVRNFFSVDGVASLLILAPHTFECMN